MNDKGKRRDIFRLINTNTYDIVMLQETHINMENTHACKEQWGKPGVWNPAESSRSGGTCVLIVNEMINLKHYKIDETGRVMAVTIEYNKNSTKI